MYRRRWGMETSRRSRGDQPRRDPNAGSRKASELTVLSGPGHVCNLERPDQFNSVIRARVRRH